MAPRGRLLHLDIIASVVPMVAADRATASRRYVVSFAVVFWELFSCLLPSSAAVGAVLVWLPSFWVVCCTVCCLVVARSVVCVGVW